MLGLGLRAYAVVNPVANPADDSHAYYALSKALYEEGSFGGPEFHDSSDWSPGAPLLYAAAFYATGGAREGTARIVEALLGRRRDPRRLPARQSGSAGRTPAGLGCAAFAVAVYPPFIHSHRRADERAAGDPHPARRGPRLPLGERTGAAARPGWCPGCCSA